MEISVKENARLGVTIEGFDSKNTLPEEIKILQEMTYRHKIVILKNQTLSPKEFVSLGRLLGKVEPYYQPMYQHPEEKEIFVSSNSSPSGLSNGQIGVPKTGKFWHSDYGFMKNPFAFTLTYPQEIPSNNRGTYFIDMTAAYSGLSNELKNKIENTYCYHSARRYFKIRPSDVYRPISEVVDEIERETPPIAHKTVIKHPDTGEKILYVNEGFSYQIQDQKKNILENEVLTTLLSESGQMDKSFSHPLIYLQTFEKGDILLWDNRALVHCALHAESDELSITHRVTLYDDHPFSGF